MKLFRMHPGDKHWLDELTDTAPKTQLELMARSARIERAQRQGNAMQSIARWMFFVGMIFTIIFTIPYLLVVFSH